MLDPLLLDPADRPQPESASPPPGFWIAGQRAAPCSDQTFDSIDPTTGHSLATLAAAAGTDIDAAVGAAAKAFASPRPGDRLTAGARGPAPAGAPNRPLR